MIFETVWRHSVHQRAYLTRSAVGSGRVVVHERATRLVGLDVRDGGVRWDMPLGRWPYALTVAGGRCLAVPQWQPWLACHEAIAGERLWRVWLPRFTGHLAVAGESWWSAGGAGTPRWRDTTWSTGRCCGGSAATWRSSSRSPSAAACCWPYAAPA
ncbi:hypothetical protein ACFQZ4_08800 [Catellatospora coxensis]